MSTKKRSLNDEGVKFDEAEKDMDFNIYKDKEYWAGAESCGWRRVYIANRDIHVYFKLPKNETNNAKVFLNNTMNMAMIASKIDLPLALDKNIEECSLS